MTRRFLQTLIALLPRIGTNPGDSDEERLQKTLFVGVTLMTCVAGILWAIVYVVFREPMAALIPLGYAVICLLNIVLFALTRHYRLFRFGQLSLILLLPWLLMIVLGGFVNSSAVILWSLLSPVGALLLDAPRHALRWFVAYVALIFISGFLQPYQRDTNNLPPLVVLIFFVLNIAAVSGIAFALLYYFVRQRRLLQEKSDNLLLNILPREIAAILKHENRVIADHFEGASILFADLVDFTPMSAMMTPVETVELLNEVFSYFDGLTEKYGVEKIKTIGDCYMVAAGVPRPRQDHAQTLVRLALEMCEYVSQREFRGKRLAFRIGINSGPVVAGVIGRRKFTYDLWGDAVNTASRMESHGVGGAIQITRATYELIHSEFYCEARGTILVKGKGEMEVWHVAGEAKGDAKATT